MWGAGVAAAGPADGFAVVHDPASSGCTREAHAGLRGALGIDEARSPWGGEVGVLRWGGGAAGLPSFLDLDGTLVALVGTPVWTGRCGPRWRPSSVGGAAALEELIGPFTLATFGPNRGRVTADPLGMRFLYVAERGRRFVVGTNAEVVATLAADPAPPARSPAVVSLAHNYYRWPGEASFEGVRVLEPGVEVHFTRGETPVVTSPPVWPWLAGSEADPIEALEATCSALLSSIGGALAAHPAPVIDLTGGKDSRLVLALVLLSTEPGRRPAFRTVGADGLRDVSIARRLAERAGIDHRLEFARKADDGRSFEAVADDFVRRTYGQVSLWDVRPISPPDPSVVRVSGLVGEALRPHVPLRTPIDQAPSVRRVRRYLARSTLGLLRPDALAALERARDEDVAQAIEGLDRCTMARAVDTFLFRMRLRQRYGPLAEIVGERRLLPLASPGAIRGSFAIGDRLRHADRVHRSIIERADPALLGVELAKGCWLGGAPPPLAQGELAASAAPASGPPAPKTLIARANASLPPERRRLFDALVADAGNPAWDHVDRARVRAGLDSYETVGTAGRRELFGAMTAALWLRR